MNDRADSGQNRGTGTQFANITLYQYSAWSGGKCGILQSANVGDLGVFKNKASSHLWVTTPQSVCFVV